MALIDSNFYTGPAQTVRDDNVLFSKYLVESLGNISPPIYGNIEERIPCEQSLCHSWISGFASDHLKFSSRTRLSEAQQLQRAFEDVQTQRGSVCVSFCQGPGWAILVHLDLKNSSSIDELSV